eukprot:25519-Rhodomonas_salina.2
MSMIPSSAAGVSESGKARFRTSTSCVIWYPHTWTSPLCKRTCRTAPASDPTPCVRTPGTDITMMYTVPGNASWR